MDSKQRSKLKSLANNLDPMVYIGKNGITREIIKLIKNIFNKKELIKIKIREDNVIEREKIALNLSENTGSEVVQIIGSKVILYKKIKRNKPRGHYNIKYKKINNDKEIKRKNIYKNKLKKNETEKIKNIRKKLNNIYKYKHLEKNIKNKNDR